MLCEFGRWFGRQECRLSLQGRDERWERLWSHTGKVEIPLESLSSINPTSTHYNEATLSLSSTVTFFLWLYAYMLSLFFTFYLLFTANIFYLKILNRNPWTKVKLGLWEDETVQSQDFAQHALCVH